ncbi:MAG: phosphoribosylformylglycinamidine (FGAM) synthase PurS component [Crocinitomicaceae bacterium]|jgi:phosphoribosylformylglycinamidine (FGAM) synthase PurS component
MRIDRTQKMTLGKFTENISELVEKVSELAERFCTNSVSDNYEYIHSEIEINPRRNLQIERIERIKANNKKETLSLETACLFLFKKYSDLFDINVCIHRSHRSKTVIDIRYLLKSSLESSEREVEENVEPMYHAKLTNPPYLLKEGEKYDVNWEHRTFNTRWRLYLRKKADLAGNKN